MALAATDEELEREEGSVKLTYQTISVYMDDTVVCSRH